MLWQFVILAPLAAPACVTPGRYHFSQEGWCKATWKGEFKAPWREADPPDHHDDQIDSDQYVVNEEFSLSVGTLQ